MRPPTPPWRLAPALTAVLALGAAAEGGAADSIPGFAPAQVARQLAIEAGIVERLDAGSTERHFRYLTEDPHPAGSERNRVLAEYTRDRFREYGLEEVELLEYQVLMPWPRSVEVEMIEPFGFVASLREDGYAVDKDSWDAAVGPTYLGMSASGEVTSEVIYAHSGNPEDYDWLEAQGIDPRGKIAIVRYSMPYSYRGFKAWEAQRRGVRALIIYSDPMEDGYRRGEVFPDGPWGPESHIQRGAITYDFIVPGDPLTPGWASTEGAHRIARDEARSIPGIIAVPMSWRDARPILENLGGPVAPHDWQGALPITYHAGPGPAKVRIQVDMDDRIRPIQVVTGRIRGSELPEELVILGNHRDAWVYGAVDPSSGSATLIEAARVLGELSRAGHRPRRTILLASWDAEEWHLTGSTEWGEQFADELRAAAVAYLNVDGSTSGPHLQVSAVASLNPLIASVARDVIDPNSRRSLLVTWQPDSGLGAGTPPPPIDNELGSGSDYTVFLNHLGVPIVDLAFDGPYGVYHSQYDDFYWMSHFGDPGFRYMTAMVEVWARLALRLANARIHSYDFRVYAATVAGFFRDLAELPDCSRHLDLGGAQDAVDQWTQAAEELASRVTEALAADDVSSERLAEANRLLLQVERQLLIDEGLPDRPWFRHALYAPRYTYAAMSLPGVREAAERGDWTTASRQLDLLAQRIEAVTEVLRQATSRLESR